MENKNTFKNSVEAIGSLNSLIAVMQHYNINFKKDNSGFFTNCVFHNDKNPSMRLTNKGGKALYNCFGCGAKGDIINFICEMEKIDNVRALKKAYEILGIELNYSIKNNIDNKLNSFINFVKKNNAVFTKNNEVYNLENIYVYFDLNSKPLYCKSKYKNQFNKKHFITKTLIETENGYKYGNSKDFENSEKVLFNLEQVKKSISKDNWIFFVEGEKDVETLKLLNLTATTIYTKKWEKSYDMDLKNAKVAVLSDSGKAGEEFKNFVVEKLKKVCKSLKILNLPDINKIGDGKNKDVTDWLDFGKTKEDLIKVLKSSLDILDKSKLQQDENGIYKIISKIENEEIKESKVYLTNFKILDVILYRNKDNYEQTIKLNLLSNQGRSTVIKVDANQCFSDVSIFRKYLGFDYIFYGDMNDLIKIQEHIINYFIKDEILIHNKSGIINLDNENILVTNKGILKSNNDFDIKQRVTNSIYNIDFTNINELNKIEAKELSYYLFNFSSKINVYNTLGLGVANMLNYFARKSSLNNLPILQIINENEIMTILNLLFNNTNQVITLNETSQLALIKFFNETYLPIFLKESNSLIIDKSKINSLSNHIYAVNEGYANILEVNSTLKKFKYNSSLILSLDKAIEVKSVKNRSNIVNYKNHLENKDIIKFLCYCPKGVEYLRRFSKSLYLYVLNSFDDEYFELEYLIIKNTYDFEEKLQKDNYKEINTAIYTMMGLRIIFCTFEKLDINIDEYLNLEEAADLIIKNIKENVLT